MPIKSFDLEFKSLGPEGSFQGLASTYGDPPDQGGDVVEHGAFSETLRHNSQRSLLVDHEHVVGVCELKDSPSGLICRGQFTMEVQKASETFYLCKSGAIRGLSIGYTVPAGGAEIRPDGVRVLKSVKLYEVSLTWAPMNQHALVSAASVKSARETVRIETALDEFRREILEALKG
jgi:HK97 family phage prohead protease